MGNSMTTPGAAGWIQHTGPDAAAARKFYADVVGWSINDMPMQDGSSYTGIFVGEGPIGGFMETGQGGAWTVYVTVPDIDAATERARKAGAEIAQEPTSMPGVGRMSAIVDPQGARIALITYESMMKQ